MIKIPALRLAPERICAHFRATTPSTTKDQGHAYPSRYLWKKFGDCFDQGCQFWTSEDGDPCEWVIMQTDDWRKWLERADSRWDIEKTIATKRSGFVRRAWLDREYFDRNGNDGRAQMGWYMCEEPTGFPVFIFDPVHAHRPSTTNAASTDSKEPK